MNERLYNDIPEGDLVRFIQNHLVGIGSDLTVNGLDADVKFVVYARVEREDRFSQIYLAAEERMFMADYWRKGVMLANGASANAEDICKSLQSWIQNKCSLSTLGQQFSWVSISKGSYEIEKGNIVEMTWTNFTQQRHKDFPELKDFIIAASQNPILRRYYPFTSMNTMHFSRCTGYPYTSDIAYVVPRGKGMYDIRQKNETLATGNGAMAAKFIADRIPKHWGPAIDGTADDIKNCS